jgi:type VI secretion system protein ImpH
MTGAFMGLTGPLGALPRHYTELLLERGRRRDWTLRDFLDIFNHRMISLFYRAWAKYRLPIAYEEAAWRHRESDRFSQGLFDLIGLGTKGLRGRLGVADQGLLFYTGLLAQHPHSASALVGFLQDYFGVPVDVVQFIGQWLSLASESRSRLGPGEAQNALGVSAVAGARVWDQQAKFRLRLGPLTFAQFCHFLPTGSAFRQLVHLSRFFAGQEHDFDVQLLLQASDVPWCRLGRRGQGAVRLGWSTWLKTREFTRDATDASFAGELDHARAVPFSHQEKGASEAGTTVHAAEFWRGGRGHERESEVSNREAE